VYAIVRAAGKQFRVSQDDVIAIDRLDAAEGDEITLDQVLMLSGDNGVTIGTPYVPGATVVGTVVRHYRGKKIRGFTYKPKKDLRRHFGHRQDLTSIQIKDIKAG
jgi:large subunit ribosomal protein L21